MANILPLRAQAHVWRIYRARFMLVGAIAIFAIACLVALTLVPSYLALSSVAPSSASSGTMHGSADDAKGLAKTSALVSAFLPIFSATSSPSEAVESALRALPVGVAIDHIAYTGAVTNAPAQLLLTGTASREKVSAYRDALSHDAHFTSVSVPVGALVGTDGGHFSMTLMLAGVPTK